MTQSPRTSARQVAGAEFVAADIGAGEAEVKRLADAALAAAGGHIDILVNNAAMLLMPTPTAQVPEQVLREAFDVNVFAPFLLTGLIAPTMAERGAGAVVNIGSITGLRGGDGSAVYDATKAVLHSFTRSWAAEFGPSGVRVNAVAPGPIATERQAEFAEHVAPVAGTHPVATNEHARRDRRGCRLPGQRRRREHPWRGFERRRRLGGRLTAAESMPQG